MLSLVGRLREDHQLAKFLQLLQPRHCAIELGGLGVVGPPVAEPVVVSCFVMVMRAVVFCCVVRRCGLAVVAVVVVAVVVVVVAVVNVFIAVLAVDCCGCCVVIEFL